MSFTRDKIIFNKFKKGKFYEDIYIENNITKEDLIDILQKNIKGNYDYHVRCVDSGGNLIEESTQFYLDIDTSSPIIARIYNDLGQLKIVTLRDSECSYTNENCDFIFEEGTAMPKDDSKVHFADWNNDDTYYIKCRDVCSYD